MAHRRITTYMSSMTAARPVPLIAAAVIAALAMSIPAVAQYGRDGRYIPSPNGVPSDPYARPIPNYSGTPGEAVGTPALPRALTVPLPTPPAMSPRIETPAPPRAGNSPGRYELPLPDARSCRAGWSPATGLTRREFEQRCDVVLGRK